MTLDDLVVTLSLDPSSFTKGQRDALDSFKKTDDEFQKRQKNLEATNKAVGASFEDISAAAVGMASVLGGVGLAAHARDTMVSVAATGRLAANIGVATNELSAFGRMVERNGGSADSAMGSLKGFSDQITRLKTLGQGSDDLFRFMGTVGAKQGDSPLDTFMRFADYAEKNKDNLQLINQVGSWAGYDQGTINTALKGRAEVLKEYAAAMQGAVSPEQAAAMQRLQSAWTGLDQAVEKTGRDIVTNAEPALTAITASITQWIERNQRLADSLGGVAGALTALAAVKPALWLLRLLGLVNPTTAAIGVSAAAASAISGAIPESTVQSWDKAYPLLGRIDAFFGLGGQGNASNETAARRSPAEREANLRADAVKLGINPDVAMAVARAEGFDRFTGDNGTSFGDFQLHTTPGGRGHAVGDEFRRITGLDPSYPRNERAADEFALRDVALHGWAAYHGAARVGISDRQGIGDINVTVQTTSQSPRDHGRIVADEVKKRVGGSDIAIQANKAF